MCRNALCPRNLNEYSVTNHLTPFMIFQNWQLVRGEKLRLYKDFKIRFIIFELSNFASIQAP